LTRITCVANCNHRAAESQKQLTGIKGAADGNTEAGIMGAADTDKERSKNRNRNRNIKWEKQKN